MIISDIITIDFQTDIEQFLNEKYPQLLRWAIVKKLADNKVVVSLSYVK